MQTVISFQTTITCILFFCLFLFLAAWVVVEIGKRNMKRAKDYEVFYKKVWNIVHNWELNDCTYRIGKQSIDRLRDMKYKNPEQTDVLEIEFLTRFKPITDKIKSDNFVKTEV